MDIFDKVVRSIIRPKRYDLNAVMALMASAGAGAGLMYMLDPDRGARRRALVRDKAVHVARRTSTVLAKGVRDVRHRSRGVLASTRAILRHEEVPDDVLCSRVRAALGRVVSHPHAIAVRADDGHVTLSGPVFEHEVEALLSTVSAVDGVMGVTNHLEAHRSADGIPSLQGASARSSDRFELMKECWTPMTRLLMGTLGAGLVGYAIKRKRRDRAGLLLGASGAAVLLRDVTNRPFKRLLGVGVGRRAVDFQKTITVRAPVDDVFSFFLSFESFPRFMAHLREVERRSDGRLHWTAVGPAHIPVSWDAEVTKLVPNKLIAWRSLPGEPIANAGVVRFEPTPDGGTRLDIKMSYNPPGGALGHAVASLFNADPKHAMDEDLMRFKSLLEQGKTTARGKEVRLEPLVSHGAR